MAQLYGMSDKAEETTPSSDQASSSMGTLVWLFLIFSPTIWAVPATLFTLALIAGLPPYLPQKPFSSAMYQFASLVGIPLVAILGFVANLGPIACARKVAGRLDVHPFLRFIAGFAIWGGIGALNAFVCFGACAALFGR